MDHACPWRRVVFMGKYIKIFFGHNIAADKNAIKYLSMGM